MSTYQGQPVLYTLNEGDVAAINGKREANGIGGNRPAVGDVCPAFLVKLWNPMYANLSVLLDGPDSYWATSRQLGDGPGYWSTEPVAQPETTAPDAL